MPIYEYKCVACGQRIERLQRIDDPPPGPCEACGGAMHRQVSAPAFQFKGTGWYVTDYADRTGSDGKDGDGKEGAAKDVAAKEGTDKGGATKDGATKDSSTKKEKPKPDSGADKAKSGSTKAGQGKG